MRANRITFPAHALALKLPLSQMAAFRSLVPSIAGTSAE